MLTKMQHVLQHYAEDTSPRGGIPAVKMLQGIQLLLIVNI